MAVRVLIVDDATFIREIIKSIAQKQGWVIVAEAEDGVEAVQKVNEYKPEVVLMDIVMPKLNGFEAAKQILRKMPDLPIIALSTMLQEEVVSQALEVGFVSYITKPFDNWSVIAAVNEAVSKREKKSG